MFVWYHPLDGECEVFHYNPCWNLQAFVSSDSVMMIPPEGWDCG